MSSAGSKILPFPNFRRSEQTGIIQRNFPARWLALILMGSVGAAYALNPTAETGDAPALSPTTARTVVEGDPQVVSQLMGSLVGELALSPADRELLGAAKTAQKRVIMESKLSAADPLQVQREKADFMMTVEELEADYMLSGRYPALPSTGGEGAALSYRTDGEDFTLGSGNRRYTAAQGMTYGKPPSAGTEFEVKGFLGSKSGGWGPWKSEGVSLEAKPGAEGLDRLGFLEELPVVPAGSARLFFPVSRSVCGYLFHKRGGASVYSSGELTYDAVGGSFSLKLYRSGAVAPHALNSSALEAELGHSDASTALVGEAALLADLGLMSAPAKGEEVVSMSTSSLLPCSVNSALDGLRLSSLERHKDVLSTGKLAAGPDVAAKATVVGRVQVADKLGQVHNLRLRGGRGANYDWIVGQICPLEEGARVAGFVDSVAASYEQPTPLERQLVKAGR